MPRLMDRLVGLWSGRDGRPTESKASRAGRLIAVESLGRPVWTPRDYASFAREGFMQNPIVYRSVRMIAEAAATGKPSRIFALNSTALEKPQTS